MGDVRCRLLAVGCWVGHDASRDLCCEAASIPCFPCKAYVLIRVSPWDTLKITKTPIHSLVQPKRAQPDSHTHRTGDRSFSSGELPCQFELELGLWMLD